VFELSASAAALWRRLREMWKPRSRDGLRGLEMNSAEQVFAAIILTAIVGFLWAHW
jgi:hypothetical protein